MECADGLGIKTYINAKTHKYLTMRDLLNILDTISEAAVGLSAGEISKYDWRFEKFIDKIKKQEPFTTVDGEEVIIDPVEANKFFNMYHIGKTFKGILKAKTIDGGEIPLSKLAKTNEFGGAAVAAGQDASTAGKEGLVVKPSQIGITDKNIPAHDFYETIVQNKALNSTDYGQVIIELAKYITSGEYVMLPEEYQGKNKEKVRKAIVDYAGEYLGVLALLYDRSRFPRKAQFEQWLGSDIGELVLNFPSKANTNLADSFATVTNPKTSHTLNISSKGTGGGAAPAISGLKVPDYIRNDPNFENAVKFIDICQKEGTIQQAFSAMDLIYSVNPQAISKKFHKYLPWSNKHPNIVEMCRENIAAGRKRDDYLMPAKYNSIIDSVSGAGTDGGKIVYAVKKDVAEAINSRDGLPEFQDAVLQILEMNFIQQYTDYKGGQLTFATQWPAKLDGQISVENKSSSTEPTAGGFSFKLGRTDNSVSDEPGEPEVDYSSSEKDLVSKAKDITGAGTISKPSQKLKVGDVGRKKR